MIIELGVNKEYVKGDIKVGWLYGEDYLRDDDDYGSVIYIYKKGLKLLSVTVRKNNLEEVRKILELYGFESEEPKKGNRHF